MDRTFVMVKPDGVARGLIGEVISRLETKGLRLVAAKLEKLPEKQVMEQYREHREKPFFPSLRHYITSPAEAAPGTIRGDFALDIGRNVIHASDSPESAHREIGIHFSQDELCSYKRVDESVLYE